MTDTEKSSLWSDLSEQLFRNVDDAFVDIFRKPNSPNNRLGSWDPTDPTTRHFKFLLWNVCERMDDEFFRLLSMIENRAIGQPTTIRYKNVDVDIDYGLAVDECRFLLEAKIGFTSVVEVGAGFGRTAHAIIRVFPDVDRYVIVDLPEVLALSRLYLSKVLSDTHYKKLRFVPATDPLPTDSFDLFINIDSFQEMSASVIRSYESNLMRRSRRCYLKQPIGKYDPQEFDIVVKARRTDVFTFGLSTELFTVCDQESYAQQLIRHLNHYLFEGSYRLISDKRCAFYHYYHHMLTERGDAESSL